MPTGYTAAVVDGKITEFPEFAMSCARVFSALVIMHDDPMDAPIPDEFVPSAYSAERLDEAKSRLARLLAMDADQTAAAAEADYFKQVADRAEYERRETEQEDRLLAMEAKVLAWTPPTPEHIEMKSFMLDQIRVSKRGDYRRAEPVRLSGYDWITDQIARARKDIDYHTTENAKEIERTRSRSEWVKSLRASLAA